MILTRVEIINYKQYGGQHVIEIPQSGAIGVIGANGVGKTTLFEAIEWALYSPSSIKAADVKPRVWRGKTEVKVTLDDPATGGRFLVERELGKGSAKARIYRVDQTGFEEKIVDGASQVTSFVIQHLIGLDHAAFVATFFTRQKELGFFNGSPTARRRDVGKLLGLQTIRDAQEIIAEDRKKAVADARSYREQSESQLKDRDFPAEIAAAETAIGTARTSLDEASIVVSAANVATATAEQALLQIEQVREQDNAIGQRILHREREHAVAREQSAHAAKNLARLDAEAVERSRLEPVAATISALVEEETAHTAMRQTALRKRELQQAIASLEQRDRDTEAQIHNAIASAPAPDGHASWNARTPDLATEWAGGIDIAALERQAAMTAQTIELHNQFTTETNTLSRYNQRVDQLRTLEASLTEGGDPSERMQQIQARLQELNGSIGAANSTATRIRDDQQKTERILANLRTQHAGEVCPTCHRPFTADETAHAIGVFEREVASHHRQLQEISELIGRNRRELGELQQEQTARAEAIKQLSETRASIASGKQHVQEQQAKVEECRLRLEQALQEEGISAVPSIQQRDEEQHALIAWRKVVDAAAAVKRASVVRAQIATERVPVDAELVTLADVAYDEARHRSVAEQLQLARQAQAAIERIDTELARRDEHTAERDRADAAMQQAQTDLETLRQQRQSLGFDAARHHQAQEALRLARLREREATEQRHRAEVALRDTEHALKTITAEKDRIGKLALEAEARQREADDLDLMYREFTEFERYAAAWYAPRLSEIASELVAQVTDGKYDRVEFDSNFSIEVFDGDDEKYPYETFSGGERDAIALCARIALSRVIGGASASPPGFLVLDEVFGSLDLERRQRLLEMLASITGADDHFRQVFIISHVDDVRTSPILDDVWRVVEREDGTSALHSLSVGEDIGEL